MNISDFPIMVTKLETTQILTPEVATMFIQIAFAINLALLAVVAWEDLGPALKA